MSSITHSKPLYKIVIAHYLFAGLFFFALTIMLLFTIDSFSGHYFQPKVLAITHAAALGWGTMIIFGALYQLLPVILETALYSTKLSWFSFGFFVPGIILLVYCFWIFDPGLNMQMASLLVLTGVMCFNANVFFTLRHKKQESIFQEFIVTACLWLTLTVLVGALMVFNFRYPFLQKDHLYYLRLHAHMGIVGWFLMLIIG
ncbi:MAG: cytochrome C oxidase subunit I, partial [Lacibacter sp.]|nr:cytochrome C oxidase subunit I [Lacibacter sp.]